MEAKDFVFQECSKKEASFTAGENIFLRNLLEGTLHLQ
jgi:hypothetical protein